MVAVLVSIAMECELSRALGTVVADGRAMISSWDGIEAECWAAIDALLDVVVDVAGDSDLGRLDLVVVRIVVELAGSGQIADE